MITGAVKMVIEAVNEAAESTIRRTPVTASSESAYERI